MPAHRHSQCVQFVSGVLWSIGNYPNFLCIIRKYYYARAHRNSVCVVCRALSDISLCMGVSVEPILCMYVLVNGAYVFVWRISFSSMRSAEYFASI